MSEGISFPYQSTKLFNWNSKKKFTKKSKNKKSKKIFLYDADPNCEHKLHPNCWSGIKCIKCGGWFCY